LAFFGPSIDIQLRPLLWLGCPQLGHSGIGKTFFALVDPKVGTFVAGSAAWNVMVQCCL
jgi:hypothetical protein